MDDQELIDALRTGLDAFDPAPPSLMTKAIAAGTWPNSRAIEARPRTEIDLVGAGMRTAASINDENAETSRDLAFEAAGHTIDITIEFATSGETSAAVIVIVTPRVEEVTIVSPFADSFPAELDATGRVALGVEPRAIALEFTAGSGAVVRTPLFRLS